MRTTTAILILLVFAACAAPAPTPAPAPVPGEPDVASRLDEYLTRLEGYGFSGAVLVARDGRVLLHEGYGSADAEGKRPFTKETVFDVGSITKQFTAAAILKLEEEGKLSVSDPITKYFEGVPPDKAGITLHHLLTHSAGLVGGLGGDYEEMPRDELVRQALASELQWPPGTRYDYSNLGYSLLGAVVEKASGQPYEKTLREKLLLPAGLEETGYRLPSWEAARLARGVQNGEDWGTPLDHAWAPDGPWWNLRANGGILSTTGDLYAWHRALLGEEILSRASKEKMFAPQMPEDPEGSSHYGYGWAIFTTPRDTKLIAHNGGNGRFAADFRRYVDEGLVVIAGSNRSDFSSIAITPELAAIAFGQEPQLPPPVAAAETATLERLAGTYALPSGGRFQVAVAPDDPMSPVAAGGLTITPEGPEAFSALLGDGGDVKEREARLLAALEATLRGDYAPLHQVYGAPGPLEAFRERFAANRARLEADFGPLRGFTLLGTGASRGRPATYVRFDLEDGSPVGEYGWEGAHVANVQIVRAPGGGTFRPVSATDFASFDPRSRNVTRLRFEGGALVLRTADGEVRAVRGEG